jgi:hypothetical protein
MIMDVYLDLNLMVDIMNSRDPELENIVCQLLTEGFTFAYSPAHIEEIANIYRSAADDRSVGKYIYKHIDFIRKLTRGKVYLPDKDIHAPTRILTEDPAICLQRVIDLYELTYFAEENEDFLRNCIPESVLKSTLADVLTNPKFCEILQARIWNRGYFEEGLAKGPSLRQNHSKLTAAIDILVRSLHEAGFGLEKKNKTRSVIHDVSHTIYATRADYFISNDQKLISKVKIIYKYLEAECIPLDKAEFINRFNRK